MKLIELLEVLSADQTVCVEERKTGEAYDLNEKRYLKLEVGLLDCTVLGVTNEYYGSINARGITIQIHKFYS